MDWAETETGANERITLFVAFNYGGRAEILDAAAAYDGGGEEAFENHLYAPEMQHERTSTCTTINQVIKATQFPTPEEHAWECPPPRSAYGFSKLTGEVDRRAAFAEHGLPFTICRPFNAYGPGGPDDALVIPDLIRKFLGRHEPDAHLRQRRTDADVHPPRRRRRRHRVRDELARRRGRGVQHRLARGDLGGRAGGAVLEGRARPRVAYARRRAVTEGGRSAAPLRVGGEGARGARVGGQGERREGRGADG